MSLSPKFSTKHIRYSILIFVLGMAGDSLLSQSHVPHSRKPMSAQDVAALHSALDAYDAGQAEQAESVLRELARRYPTNYAANEALGSLYAEAGQNLQAVPYLQRACALAPREALAHANLGAAYLKLERPSDALRELGSATAIDPHNGLTQSNVGQAYMLLHQPKAAANAFSIAAGLSPGDVSLQYNWALALYESGSSAAAAKVLEKIPSGSRNDQVHSLAADAEEHVGDYEKAVSHFQAAAQLNPSDANLYALTLELLRHWTWPEAIKVATYGAKQYPASTHFKMAAGIGYYGNSDYRHAVEVFSSLLQADPNNAKVADLLGRSCSLLADGDNAGCDGIDAFVLRHPGNAVTTTYAAVAILHEPQEKQDLERAASLLKSAIAADPNYAEAYFQLGVLEQSRLRWKESATDLERAIALRPEFPEAHYRLSRAYTHLGRRDEAQQQIALHQTYADQAKTRLDAKMQEVVKFLLKPS